MTLRRKIDPRDPDEETIQEACAVIKAGGMVAFPTETFYGLAVDALNQAALDRLFALKRRSRTKPLLVIISHRSRLADLVIESPEPAEKLMDRFWPGPLTIVFKARSGLPPVLTGGSDTVGVRISSHPVALRLSSACGRPLTATSANISGGRSPATAEDVCKQLGDGLDMILDGGETTGTRGSTIIDVTVSPPRIVRDGDVPVAEVESVVAVHRRER